MLRTLCLQVVIPWIYPSLFDMTKQKTGIVIYQEHFILVCNWAESCANGGLPVIDNNGKIVNTHAEIFCDDVYSSHDIRRVIAGSYAGFSNMEVLTDPYGVLPALWGFDSGKGAALQLDHHNRPVHIGGTVYILHDGTKIIAPDSWP